MKGSNLATALRLQRVSKSPLQFNLVTLKAKSLGLGPLRDPHPQALILKSLHRGPNYRNPSYPTL